MRIHTLPELESCLQNVLGECHSAGVHIIALSGDLGVGKTTSVQILGKLLGCLDTITSPTYVIMKMYTLPPSAPFHTLTHIDAYRIEDEMEIPPLKLNAYFEDVSNLVCIEWPEHLGTYLPQDVCRVHYDLHPDGSRDITWSL